MNEGRVDRRERKMELCMKHDNNAKIWHGSLFTGLTNTLY
jgi:hypothetical protein